MNSQLDELYLTWLYSQTGSIKLKNRSRTYWSLLKLLYTKEFVYFIPNDDNRAMDGTDLRYDFIDAEELDDVNLDWINLSCSMLELFVGLSRRLSFAAEGEPSDWFWRIMQNLDLDIYNDSVSIPLDEVDEKLNQIIWRTYEPDGLGGIFPLKWPERDQRDIEIWYQMASYVLEL